MALFLHFFSHFCDLVPSGNPITHKFDRQHHDLSQLVHHLTLELVRVEGVTKRVKKCRKRADKSHKQLKIVEQSQTESNRMEVRPCLLIFEPKFCFPVFCYKLFFWFESIYFVKKKNSKNNFIKFCWPEWQVRFGFLYPPFDK